ncbi:MAG: hypothetical protein ACRYFR_16140 [Janthinobacterium lividum]
MFNSFKKGFGAFRSAPVNPLALQLQTVSIRGRVAYCTTCLEVIFAAEKLNAAAFAPLLSCLWDFTSSNDLSEWEDKAMDFYSVSILVEGFDEQQQLKADDFQRLKTSYSELSAGQLVCIDETIEVGRGNLYASTAGGSADTLASTLNIVQHMQTNNYPLPSIDRFLRSPFCEEDQHGWGKRADRSFFQ